jgi:hypothetical protein
MAMDGESKSGPTGKRIAGQAELATAHGSRHTGSEDCQWKGSASFGGLHVGRQDRFGTVDIRTQSMPGNTCGGLNPQSATRWNLVPLKNR